MVLLNQKRLVGEKNVRIYSLLKNQRLSKGLKIGFNSQVIKHENFFML